MNDPEHALVEALRAGIAEAADPERAPRMQAYMKSEMPFRGVSAVPLRRIYREVLARHRLEGRTSWEAAVRTLWDEASFREERYAAVALTGHRYYREYQDLATLDLYRHLVVTGAWWDFVDDIAAHRIGPLLAAFPMAMTPVVRSWAGDDDLWVRRTAILCQLARKEATDPDLLAEVVEANLEGTVFDERVLHPQGDRVGAAGVRQDRPRLGALLRGAPLGADVRTVPPRGAEEPDVVGLAG